ncbi:MAG: hypothetical protein KC729_06840, partial [Candidatus Eisenbacteria bacterium]|nr:hypothetical protein [Candidatus Eisenbacteria bacterium]
LGVLLYELLVGVLPFARAQRSLPGLALHLRALSEGDLLAPSARLRGLREEAATSAARRRTDATGLRRALRGDLDWIVLRALAPERTRRYDSAKELGADVERHLAHEPVEAGPPTRRYVLRKFVRRHRTGVTAGAVALVSLLILAVILSLQAQRVARARDVAIRERDRAEAAHLYTLAENETVPSRALAYAMRSLELADQEHVRRLALAKLGQGPAYSHFYTPTEPEVFNPWAVDFSEDGRWLVVGWSHEGYVLLFPLPDGDPIRLVGHDAWIYEAQFTADSRRLVTGAYDGTVRVWSVPSGTQEALLDVGTITVLRLRVLEDRPEVIVWTAAEGKVEFHRWNYETGEDRTIATWPQRSDLFGDVARVDVDPTGSWALVSRGGDLRMLAVEDLDAEGRLLPGVHRDSINFVTISPRGRTFAAASLDGDVTVWRTPTKPDSPAELLQVRHRDGVEDVLGLGIDPDERFVWLGSRAGIDLFDMSTPPGAASLSLQPRRPWWGFRCAFHRSEPSVVTTGTNSILGAWSLARPFPIVLRPEHDPRSLFFAHDGAWLAVACSGGIWTWPLDPAHGLGPRQVLARAHHEFWELCGDDHGRFLFTTAA